MLGGKKPIIVGFENHGGRTYLGPNAEALGTVIKGFGNNATDGTEGAFYRNAIATYSHGPLIPKNPFIADWMIKTALQDKYQTEINLAPLDDSLADRARAAMLKRLEVN
jgi:lipid II isoglutaminyl synthase (glutamine-hydrolysing)